MFSLEEVKEDISILETRGHFYLALTFFLSV